MTREIELTVSPKFHLFFPLDKICQSSKKGKNAKEKSGEIHGDSKGSEGPEKSTNSNGKGEGTAMVSSKDAYVLVYKRRICKNVDGVEGHPGGGAAHAPVLDAELERHINDVDADLKRQISAYEVRDCPNLSISFVGACASVR
jgi:hypothetical protein